MESCLFRTLAHQLFDYKNGSDELETATAELRQDVVNFIDENFEAFKSILDGRLLEEKLEEDKKAQLPKDTTNLRKQLLNEIRNGEWGGGETIYAVSSMYQCNIICFNENSEPTTVGDYKLDTKRCVFIAYRENPLLRVRNHYDSAIAWDIALCTKLATLMATNGFKQKQSQE